MGTTLSTKSEPDSQSDSPPVALVKAAHFEAASNKATQPKAAHPEASQNKTAQNKTAPLKTAQNKTVQTVRCPTCGSLAERSFLRNNIASNGECSIQTACPSCDYLMVITSLTGKVLEAYAPGQVSA